MEKHVLTRKLKNYMNIILRSFIPNLLSIRGWAYKSNLDNVYLASVQKTGSQWFSAVFSDTRIRAYTKLRLFPQHRYEWDDFHKIFPKGTIVPGLYMSYDLYEEISKSTKYKTIYILRDPRDITVSWYWSMKESHALMGKVGKYRDAISKMDFDEGLHYCIDALTTKYAAIRTWALNWDDDSILLVRFEDLVNDPRSVLDSINEFCDFNISGDILTEVSDFYSKDNMRKRDMDKRDNKTESHYRKKSSSHKESFKAEHYEHFYNVTGDLVKFLGYKI